jgi:hypothetical protein
VYNIKKAVSRLDFAPKLDDIKIIDIKKGHGEFTPKPDKAVSFAGVKNALKKAGYVLDSANITVIGTLVKDASGLWLEVAESKQRFALEGDSARQLSVETTAGERFQINGDWQTDERSKIKREVIKLRSAEKIASSEKHLDRSQLAFAKSIAIPLQVSFTSRHFVKSTGFAKGFELSSAPTLILDEPRKGDNEDVEPEESTGSLAFFLAPIRTTSPGLTVYKGGGIYPRYYYTKQHLGGLEVNRQALRLGASYTPTSTLQLEGEIAYWHTSYKGNLGKGSGQGFGNLTLWGKYRFFRTLETWGDKQAAIRIGLELPTGKKSAPGQRELAADEFVRQQLSPINGGTAIHTDLSYSQARQRFIFGANIEGTLRSQRDGFRMGQEMRVNTDFEYVLLPFHYRSPGKELFAILETTYSYQGRGQLNGRKVQGSSSSEFYLAPGLQFTLSPRVVLEASYQFPVVHNTGPLVLRTDRNLLIGVRLLY